MAVTKLNKSIFKKQPLGIISPLCRRLHRWEGKSLDSYQGPFNSYNYWCNGQEMRIWINETKGTVFFDLVYPCEGIGIRQQFEVKIQEFQNSQWGDKTIFTINRLLKGERVCGADACSERFCDYSERCEYFLGEKGKYEVNVVAGFKFSEEDLESIEEDFEYELEEDNLESEEDNTTQKDTDVLIKDEESKNNNITKNKEDAVMATTLREQIYEHSPKENVELIKDFLERYKPALRWAVPVACVYGAYQIVNSKDIDVNELSKKCKKEMGFEFEVLKDKKTLKELVALGGIVAGAYAFCKVLNFAGNMTSPSIEEIEEKMETVEEAHKKFDWIQPKVEKLMPVAVSVLVVYVLTQKPQWFEKAKEKVDNVVGDVSTKTGVYLDMAKLFISAKLNIDLDDEEQAKKFRAFAMLSAVVGVGAFLYGKGVFNMKDDESFMDKNPRLKEFIEQTKAIMEKILPTAFSAVTTYMVTKHIIDGEEEQAFEDEDKEDKNVVDGDVKKVENDTEVGTTWL